MAKAKKTAKDSKKSKSSVDSKSRGTKTDITVSKQPSLSKNWREYLQTCNVNTDNFNCETLILIESSMKCFPILDQLVKEIEETEQSRIRSITQDDINNLATGKVNTKNLGHLVPIIKKISAECKKEMASKKFISPEFQALLIKLQILIIRERYVSHKENYYELKQVMEEEQKDLLSMNSDLPKTKKKAGSPKKKDKKSKKNKKADSEINCDGINVMLDSRSNDIRKLMKQLNQSTDFVEPYEGVDIYFVICKMYDYDALKELSNININTIALIDFAVEPAKFSTEIYHITPFESSNEQQVRLIDISNFWRACGIDKADTLFTLPKECCYLRYFPNKIDPLFPENIAMIYNDVIKISYNLSRLKKLHQDYLESINVLDVEEIKPPVKLRHMKKYNMILNKIPYELQSIPVILHALVEEVITRIPADPNKPEDSKLITSRLHYILSSFLFQYYTTWIANHLLNQ